jgi:outer membrane protein
VKIRKFFVPVMMLGMAALASAQSPAPQKPATINMQKAMLGTKDGEKASADLQAKFAPRNAAIEKKKADILAKQDQLKKGAATMSQEAQARLAREIEADQKAVQRDQEDFEADLQAEEGKIYNELGGRVYEVLGKYATQNGLSLVMDTSNQQSPVIWADNTIDITADIIKLYDLAHPAAAAPATPAAATKPPAAATAPVTKKQ